MTDRQKKIAELTELIKKADETTMLTFFCIFYGAFGKVGDMPEMLVYQSKGAYKRVIKKLRIAQSNMRAEGKTDSVEAYDRTIAFIRSELMHKEARA